MEVEAGFVVVRYRELGTLESFEVVQNQVKDFNWGPVDMVSFGEGPEESPLGKLGLLFGQKIPEIIVFLMSTYLVSRVLDLLRLTFEIKGRLEMLSVENRVRRQESAALYLGIVVGEFILGRAAFNPFILNKRTVVLQVLFLGYFFK